LTAEQRRYSSLAGKAADSCRKQTHSLLPQLPVRRPCEQKLSAKEVVEAWEGRRVNWSYKHFLWQLQCVLLDRSFKPLSAQVNEGNTIIEDGATCSNLSYSKPVFNKQSGCRALEWSQTGSKLHAQKGENVTGFTWFFSWVEKSPQKNYAE
jgi:hypothetical protein